LFNPLPRLYHWYRRLHPRHRRAAVLAAASEQFRHSAWEWPIDRRNDWILSHLRQTLVNAASGSTFYRRRLADAGVDPAAIGFEEFGQLPALTREEVAEHSAEILLADPDDPQVRRDSTGGSSGRPTTIWKGIEERAWGEGGIDFFMRRHRMPPGARQALLWGHHLDTRESDSWRARLHALASNATWLEAFRLSPELLMAHHDCLNRLRPDYIVAYAGALAELAAVVERSGIPPVYPQVALVTGAEKVHRHERELIERVFGVPLLERYGSRDVGLMAFQTDPDASLGFEVDWPNLLIEPETSDPESPILVTKLHADAFPMIRYRVGDLARFAADAKPGHPSFRLLEILGRELEMIQIGPDSWLSGTNFPHMFKDFPVADFQVYQGADAAVEVRVVPTDRSAWTEEVTSRFDGGMRAVLGGTPHTLLFVGEIPRTAANKRRPVISELARRRQ